MLSSLVVNNCGLVLGHPRHYGVQAEPRPTHPKQTLFFLIFAWLTVALHLYSLMNSSWELANCEKVCIQKDNILKR